MAHIIEGSVLTFVLVAGYSGILRDTQGYSGTLGLLMAYILGASVLTFVLAEEEKKDGGLRIEICIWGWSWGWETPYDIIREVEVDSECRADYASCGYVRFLVRWQAR